MLGDSLTAGHEELEEIVNLLMRLVWRHRLASLDDDGELLEDQIGGAYFLVTADSGRRYEIRVRLREEGSP